ncbi:MAG: ABC transporter ATP-binding protein [Candidatus Hodarchaeales archaeon]|jgi:putative ABC transport system ATP-binding protein
MMNKQFISTSNLTKIYDGNTRALNGVNMKIREGDWTSLIGPSGSGKTTLLNMISCLDKPTSGSVSINGIEVTELNQAELTRFRRDNIGLIFQQHYLIPYLTALENVMIAMYYHSVVDENFAREALERVGLGHRLDHKPSKLSGGEQQRVCIARALINDPRILVADEPTGNLDQKNGQIVLDLIRDLKDEGHTILLVTHDQNIARKGNRILEIIDGEITNEV